MVAEPLVRSLVVKRLALLLLLVSGCHAVEERLPALPSFAYQNAASVTRFREADALAREEGDAESIGRLGMLYHAYQFHGEARAAYALARELAPKEFRWIYYSAMLEKTTFAYEAAESLFQQALVLRPEDPELWAQLGDLYLMWSRRDEARADLNRALELDPVQPVAALGIARLLSLEQDWTGVIALMTPLLERYPRLSKAHQFLGAAYGAVGETELEAFHIDAGKYGSAVASELMNELNELAVPAILAGDPAPGPELLQEKCARCHTHERIYDHDEDRRWWARTVRRMQREAGWQWLTDDQAASVVAYLDERERND